MPPPIDRAIDELFTLEADALRAYRQADPGEYNSLLNALSALSPDPAIRFGLTPRHGKLDEFEQAMFAEVNEAIHPRHVYKLSTYTGDDGGLHYAVFVSAQNPPPRLFRLSEVYWLSRPGPTRPPQITAYHQRDEQAGDGPTWRLAAGTLPLAFGDAVPQSIDRYLAPDADPWGLDQYRAEI